MKTTVIFLALFLFTGLTFSQAGLQWARHYNGIANGNEYGKSIGKDANGNIYVACASQNPNLDYDYLIIKYNSAGDSLWSRRYDGPVNGNDIPSKLVVDNNGNVIVTGTSPNTNNDCATVKYNPNGFLQWAARYNSGSEDFARFAAVDGSGNIFVTGKIFNTVGSHYDFLTIKYNSSGDTVWARKFNHSNLPPGYGPYNDSALCVAVDNFGNCYVAGLGSPNINQSDGVLVRYSSSGVQQWVAVYSTPGIPGAPDFFTYVTVDAANNVLVTGVCDLYYNAITIKYNAAGTKLWERICNYYPFHFEGGLLIAVDSSNNPIIASIYHVVPDLPVRDEWVITKLNGITGDTLWYRRYVGPGQSYDLPKGLLTDDSGNVYITGQSYTSSTNYDFLTIKFSGAGDSVWSRSYNRSGTADDIPNAITMDNCRNLYITGLSGTDVTTIRYSQTTPPVPVLSSPPNNSTGQPANVTLKWLKSQCAANYRVQLATDSLFTNLVVNDSTLTDTLRQVTGLNYLTNYWWRVNARTAAGTSVYSTVWKFRTIDPVGINQTSTEIPDKFALFQNYPNPFNPVTRLKFAIPPSSQGNVHSGSLGVKLVVYNLLGEEITVLVNEQLHPGYYEAVWDAVNYPSGVYYYKLTAGDPSSRTGFSFTDVKKMVVVK